MKKRVFIDLNGKELIVQHRKSAVFFNRVANPENFEMHKLKYLWKNGQIVLNDEEEARPHYKRCELDANYEFSEETIKDLYEYLLSIASESWKEFTPKEADSIGADYDSYWDCDHEDEGSLSLNTTLNRNYSIYIEAPYQKTNKDNMVRLYKFNKRKFESFVYDLGKIVGQDLNSILKDLNIFSSFLFWE